jgi:hypothetical protein
MRERRFAPFFWTQFSGAANDNLFKFAFTVMVTYQLQLAWLPPALAGLVIGAVFILPFVLFSATSGHLADKFEKSRMMREVKKLELAIMAVAAAGFLLPQPQLQAALLLACTFFMGLHSTVFGPLTRYQCCPPTCGAAAAIVCSADFAKKHKLDASVVIAAQAMTTDPEATLEGHSMMRVIGFEMARNAAREVYERAGIGPQEVDVCELHDCFTTNELLTYEALGLAPEGGGEKFVMDGDHTYGGQVVTNPSGGLLSKGHPLGATGLAQCAELTWQLRGQAQARQVEGARLALQHNLGLGGACVVTMYRKAA